MGSFTNITTHGASFGQVAPPPPSVEPAELTLTFSQISSPLTIAVGANTSYVPLIPLVIDWGDGTSTTYMAGDTVPASVSHTYSDTNAQTVTIEGQLNLLRNGTTLLSNNKTYLTSCVGSLGTVPSNTTDASSYLTSLFNGFYNLTTPPTIEPLPPSVIIANNYLSSMFTYNGCSSLSSPVIIPPLPSSVRSANNYLSSMCSYTDHWNADMIEIPALPYGVETANYYLYLFTYANADGRPTHFIPALPESVTSATYYLTSFSSSKHNVITNIPPLPSGITDFEGYLSTAFRSINLTTIPEDFVLDPRAYGFTNAYKYTFANPGSSYGYPINRTAASIIGDIPEPETPLYTFCPAFSDYADLPANWKQ